MGKALLAIILGNIVYFLAMPHIPFRWQHQSFDIDLGLGADLLCCVVVYIIIDAAYRPAGKKS